MVKSNESRKPIVMRKKSEMITRIEESLQSINNKQVVTVDAFKESNKEWLLNYNYRKKSN